MLAYFNAINGCYTTMFADPCTFANNDFRIVSDSIFHRDWSEERISSDADMTTNVNTLRIIENYPPDMLI